MWACQAQISRIEAASELHAGELPQSGWEPVSLPDVWRPQWLGLPGGLWYRVAWTNACQDQPVALAVDRMVMAAQVYHNGELLWQDESLQAPMSRGWNMPRYWVLPASTLRGENTLLFRLVSERHPMPGLGTLTLGDLHSVLDVHERNVWQQRDALVINVIISLMIAALFLLIWLMRPKEHALGWFALSSLLWSFGMLNMFLTTPWPFESGIVWDRISLILLISYPSAFAMFVWSFGGLRFPRLTPLLWGSTALIALVIALIPAEHIVVLQFVCTVSYRIIFSLICLGYSIYALRTRQPGQMLLGVCLLIFLLLNFYDLLAHLGFLSHFQDLKALSAPISSVVMFVIVAWRFVSGLRRIETFNEELQQAVNTTREELTRILRREHELEGTNIRLNERLRMTHDLHDSMGSSLMRSIIMAEQNRSLERSQFLSMLKELRNDLRHVIDGSSSAAAVDYSTPTVWIAPLRRRFSALFDELDVNTRWRLPEQWPFEVGSARLLALTRFLEEALTNVLKHSQCSELEITLQLDEDQRMRLTVRDNGRGFDTAGVGEQGRGIGMNSMRMRIERIGGQLNITSKPGETQLTATFSAEALSPHS